MIRIKQMNYQKVKSFSYLSVKNHVSIKVLKDVAALEMNRRIYL